MYCAYITTLKGLRKHSNADRLQCVEVFGQNVIVDLSYQEGQKVIFFPSDGQLSLEYATDLSERKTRMETTLVVIWILRREM